MLDLHIPSNSEYIFVKFLILWILYDCWYCCCYQKNWKLFQFVVVVFDWKIWAIETESLCEVTIFSCTRNMVSRHYESPVFWQFSDCYLPNPNACKNICSGFRWSFSSFASSWRKLSPEKNCLILEYIGRWTFGRVSLQRWEAILYQIPGTWYRIRISNNSDEWYILL